MERVVEVAVVGMAAGAVGRARRVGPLVAAAATHRREARALAVEVVPEAVLEAVAEAVVAAPALVGVASVEQEVDPAAGSRQRELRWRPVDRCPPAAKQFTFVTPTRLVIHAGRDHPPAVVSVGVHSGNNAHQPTARIDIRRGARKLDRFATQPAPR